MYVAAIIDGDSRMCLSLVALTNKLTLTVYNEVFLPFVRAWGFPDQLVTDQGPEFHLAAFACHAVKGLTGFSATRAPHKCTKSTSNVRSFGDSNCWSKCWSIPLNWLAAPSLTLSCGQIRVEKFNIEVNVRCLVPVRMLLNALEHNSMMDKDNALQVGAFAAIVVCLLKVMHPAQQPFRLTLACISCSTSEKTSFPPERRLVWTDCVLHGMSITCLPSVGNQVAAASPGCGCSNGRTHHRR